MGWMGWSVKNLSVTKFSNPISEEEEKRGGGEFRLTCPSAKAALARKGDIPNTRTGYIYLKIL